MTIPRWRHPFTSSPSRLQKRFLLKHIVRHINSRHIPPSLECTMHVKWSSCSTRICKFPPKVHLHWPIGMQHNYSFRPQVRARCSRNIQGAWLAQSMRQIAHMHADLSGSLLFTLTRAFCLNWTPNAWDQVELQTSWSCICFMFANSDGNTTAGNLSPASQSQSQDSAQQV